MIHSMIGAINSFNKLGVGFRIGPAGPRIETGRLMSAPAEDAAVVFDRSASAPPSHCLSHAWAGRGCGGYCAERLHSLAESGPHANRTNPRRTCAAW